MLKTFNNLLKNKNCIQNTYKRTKAAKVSMFINGKQVTVPKYYTILQALQQERIACPHFCYHERLAIAGNCRMCLVQVIGMWKPQIACATNVSEGMKVQTISDVTQKAQESVLEFILADHPLDCPVCDQGGECDLQDLTMRFGNDRSRFTDIHFEGKRAVENKDLGPLIRTSMNRCIHCTRCIRFASQVCGMDVLGTTGRGHDMLVGTYVDKMFLSELSGNIIDLCPVGSLTSIPYMFKARPWEVKRSNSIDVTDATGTNIELNYRFDRVIRVLPREHDEVNQEWVSDKGRWAVDSLDMQRLVSPMADMGDGLREIGWDYALRIAMTMIDDVKGNMAAIAGPHTNIETLVACKDLMNSLGSEQTYIERNMCYTLSGADIRAAYSLNIPMKDIPKADAIILIGTNPRFEAPVLNVWIRQAYRTNDCDIYVIGTKSDYNYHVEYLGDNIDALKKTAPILKKAKNPLIFVGFAVLETEISNQVMLECTKLAAKADSDAAFWQVLHVVPLDASFCGALEVGWQSNGIQYLNEASPPLVFLLGCDEILRYWKPPPSTKIIYVGFQGDLGAKKACLVLPGAAYTEAGGFYMNMENRVQYAMPSVTPPGKARSDWKIFRALAEYCCVNLPYSDQQSMVARMADISPALAELDTYHCKAFGDLLEKLVIKAAEPRGTRLITTPMQTIKDFYCSDVYSYNSPTMIRAYKAATDYEESAYAKN